MPAIRLQLLSVLLLMVLPSAPVLAQVRLNLATLAPDGSIWMQALNSAQEEIEAATDGGVIHAADQSTAVHADASLAVSAREIAIRPSRTAPSCGHRGRRTRART